MALKELLFTARIRATEADASTDVIAVELPADYSDTLDYSDMSGLPNVAASGGNTGDIQLTTVGHGSGDTYSVVLHCLKQY